MADWSDGYVTHTDYTSGFYAGLSPHAQNFALLYRGYAAPELAQGFTYCELGCGLGFSTALLAAANPEGAFWGIDFNPSHIAAAEQLKHAAGIPNVTFLEKSFAECLQADLPQFDYIALHGVWSWISAGNRRAILELIHARLKPGGVVYVSYNAMPGWSAAAPLRQLLVERLRGLGGVTAESINTAISFAERLRDAKAGYFLVNPAGGIRLEQIANMPPKYVAHEYFNRDWSASYHSEVAAELAEAKLVFAGASALVDQLDALVLSPSARELLKEVTDPTARETVRDYFVNTRFRRDLFIRGARVLSQVEREERLLRTPVVLTRPPPEFPFKVLAPVGEVTIEANPAKAVFDALAEGARPLGEILKDPGVEATGGGNAAFQAIAILLAGGALLPALAPDQAEMRRGGVAAFNRAMISGPDRPEHVLAASVLGTGVGVSRTDQLLLLHAAGDVTPSGDALLQQMAARNWSFMEDGKPASPKETRAELEKTLTRFRSERLPIYRHLGMI